MPLKNGELTLGELKRLIRQYNKLMSVDTKGMTRPELIKKIEDMGYTIDHKNAKLTGKRGVKDKQRKPTQVDLPPAKPRPTKEEALKKKKDKAEAKAQERITTLKDAEKKKEVLRKALARKRAGRAKPAPAPAKKPGPAKKPDKRAENKKKKEAEQKAQEDKEFLEKQDKDEVVARKKLDTFLSKYELINAGDKRLIAKVLKDKQKYRLLSFMERSSNRQAKGQTGAGPQWPGFLISGLQYNKGRDKDPMDYSSAVNISQAFVVNKK
tara:strand:- start:13757 stop:14557 length:801 start_codon:yes stop_codon:yes gene_type:complete